MLEPPAKAVLKLVACKYMKTSQNKKADLNCSSMSLNYEDSYHNRSIAKIGEKTIVDSDILIFIHYFAISKN